MAKKFKYKLQFDWHFCYFHAVDDHNNLRHSLTSIENTWVTDQWECRVFAFILAISEVNVFLIICYFVYCGIRWERTPTLLEFCRKLACQLITNIKIGEREEGVDFLTHSIHWLMTAPRYARRYHNRRLICTEKTAYQQYNCGFKRGKI